MRCAKCGTVIVTSDGFCRSEFCVPLMIKHTNILNDHSLGNGFLRDKIKKLENKLAEVEKQRDILSSCVLGINKILSKVTFRTSDAAIKGQIEKAVEKINGEKDER